MVGARGILAATCSLGTVGSQRLSGGKTLIRRMLCAAITSSSLGDPWRFIATGDSRGSDNGVNATILGELATEIVNQSVELVIFPGDLVTGGVDQATLESQLLNWRGIMQPVYDAGIGVYPVRGNHDLGSPAGVTRRQRS